MKKIVKNIQIEAKKAFPVYSASTDDLRIEIIYKCLGGGCIDNSEMDINISFKNISVYDDGRPLTNYEIINENLIAKMNAFTEALRENVSRARSIENSIEQSIWSMTRETATMS